MLRPGGQYRVGIVFNKAARCETDLVSSVRNCVFFAHTTGFFIETAPVVAGASLRATGKQRKAEAGCCQVNPNQFGPEWPLVDWFLE